jgi:hypothetical protein
MAKRSNFDKPTEAQTEHAGPGLAEPTVESPGAESGGVAAPACGPAESGGKKWAVALFGANGKERILASLKRLNLPRMVKAVDADGENIPVDGIIAGIIVDVVPSPVSTIKGSLLWLHLVDFDEDGSPRANGREITFPAVGVVRAALAPGVESDKGKDNGEEKSREKMLEFKGHLILLQRQPDKMNSKYKKAMGMWDVRVSDGPLDIGVKIH